MQEALSIVKRELGDEAVILKTETVPKSGLFDLKKKSEIEVVAALDPGIATGKSSGRASKKTLGGSSGYFAKPALPSSMKYDESMKDEFTKMLNQEYEKKAVFPESKPVLQKLTPKKIKPVKKTGQKKNKAMESLTAEVGELRTLINSMDTKISRMRNMSVKEFADMPAPHTDEIMTLIARGVDTQVARHLVEKAANAVPVNVLHESGVLRTSVLQKMAEMIHTSGPITCARGKARVIAFVGPTGSGKTTTLAKLAANSKFVFNKKVALISADTSRMSALEHLNTFAGISKLPLNAVYSPDELKASLAAHKDKDLIFIDTAGRSSREGGNITALSDFLKMADSAEIHLVLPVNMNNIDILDTLRRYRQLNVNRVIISKVDETNARGGILNIAAESSLPISYITTGQTIPDDIVLANPQKISKLILGME